MENDQKSEKKSFWSRIANLFRPMDLRQGTIWKVVLAFSFPIILSYLFQQIYTISDAAICGQTLSAGKVAGINDTTSLVFIFLQFAFGSTAGFCVITALRIGADDKAGTRKSFATQIILCAIISGVLTALSIVLLDPMLAWLNVTPDNPEVYDAAKTYCTIIFSGIVAQMFYNFICSLLRSIGDSFTPLMFLIGSTILNIALDLLFIVVFNWGVAGAASATVLAQGFSTIACFIYTFVKYKDLRLHKEDFKLSAKDIREHLTQGLPLGLQYSVLAIGIIVMQSCVVRFDLLGGIMTESHAAQNGFGSATKLNNFMMSPLVGFSSALISFSAQNYGAGNHERVKKGTRQSLIIMLILYAIIAGIGLLLTINGAYLYIFLSADKITPDTIKYGNVYLYTDFILYFILGVLFVLRGMVQGVGNSACVFGAGVGELVARVVICLVLPTLLNGAPIDANASTLSYFGLCLADPMAWLAADIVLIIGYALYKKRVKKIQNKKQTA